MPRWVLAGLAAALLVTATASVYFYSQDLSLSATVASQDSRVRQLESNLSGDAAAIAALNSSLGLRNATVAQLQADVNTLNGRITSLTQEVSALEANQTGIQANLAQSQAKVNALDAQVSSLRNESAALQLQLVMAGEARGWYVTSYFINETFVVQANSSLLIVEDSNGHNGTIALILNPSPGCGSSGTSGLPGEQGFSLLVGLGGAGGFNTFGTVGPAPFFVYIQNTGSATATCSVSAFYVYQGAPTY